MNKRALYESIMKSVAKEVKKALNEGTWGKAPLDSDHAHDMCYDLLAEILNFFKKNITNNLKVHNTGVLWGTIGCFIRFIHDFANKSETFVFSFNDEILNPLKDLFDKAIKTIENDKEWLASWKNAERFPIYLEKAKKDLDKIFKYLVDNDLPIDDIDFYETKYLEEGECCGSGDCMGGVSMPYNTPMNTVGVGNVVPAGMNGQLGSGDLLVPIKKPAIKKPARQFRKRK